jgi:hypothetical protein
MPDGISQQLLVILHRNGVMVVASPKVDLFVQIPIINNGIIDSQRSFRMKSDIGNHVYRAGSAGNSSILKGAIRPHGNNGSRTPLWRDKLCKFKDVAFLRNLSNSSSSKLDSLSDHTRNSIRITDVIAKRQVSFAKSSENKVYEIESLSMLRKDDIWWSIDELVAFRAKGQMASLGNWTVQKYVADFDQAQREVLTSRKLSSESMRELVTGLAKGYLGLETLLRINQRSESIRDHVVSVVRFFREASGLESTIHLNDSVSSFSSQNSNSKFIFNLHVRDQNVRKYAANLSAGNRHFARAMGNAEYLAAIRDCREESRCQ